jgi:hypothetical protein
MKRLVFPNVRHSAMSIMLVCSGASKTKRNIKDEGGFG